MKPTIGRIVLYKLTAEDMATIAASGSVTGRYNNIPESLPAIIVNVWSDICVNLQVFIDGHTSMIWKTSINQGDGLGQWNWPVIEFKFKSADTDVELR
jgi:hypothetical protein